MSGETTKRNPYTVIWYWLLALASVSVLVSVLHLPSKIALFLMFGAAFWKASLVVWNYMHLKNEGKLIYLIAAIPIVLFIILVALLIPDFLVRRNAIPPPPDASVHGTP